MLDVCSVQPLMSNGSLRKQNQSLKKPHKKRYASDVVAKSSAASACAISDDSSWDASLGTVARFYASVPMPSYAREPIDVLEELSSHLMMLPVCQGRFSWFLKTFATLAKQSCIFIAKEVMNLPEPESACYEALSKLILPHEKNARSAAKREVREKLELPSPTVHGTVEDENIRKTYSYVMAFLFQQMIQANDAMGLHSFNTAFSCPHNKVPSISLLLFIQRVMRYLPATKELYVIAMIYLDRVLAYNSDICFTLFNAHRLFVSAVLIASKFLDDLFYTNVFVSKVAGVSPEELNRLEIEFLAAIRFNLYVKPELYQFYTDNFNQLVAVCDMLPLDTVVNPTPGGCSPLVRSSYSVVDEFFLHVESERQRIALPVKKQVFAEPSAPSTLKPLSCKTKSVRINSSTSADDSTVTNAATTTKTSKTTTSTATKTTTTTTTNPTKAVIGHGPSRLSTTTKVPFKRPSAVLSSSSRCSTETSCSSFNSSCSSWSFNSPEF